MNIKKSLSRFTPYLFLLPGFLFLLIWIIYPMFKALQMSFYEWSISPEKQSVFIGLNNFIRALHDNLFWLSLKNTVLYAIITVSGQLILGLFVALLMDNIIKGRVVFRTIYYLPVVTSWVVSSAIFKYLFNPSSSGFINYVLVDLLHMFSKPIEWLNYPNTAFIVIYTLGIWKGVGWTMVIFLAALQSMPEELSDAARVDGANGIQLARHITIPLLAPTIILVAVMLTIGAFQTYVPIALITQGGPIHRTEVILSYMYNQAFTNRDFGYASAIAFILIIIVFIISQVQMKIRTEKTHY
jgi:multiple sugar transport system permease protein